MTRNHDFHGLNEHISFSARIRVETVTLYWNMNSEIKVQTFLSNFPYMGNSTVLVKEVINLGCATIDVFQLFSPLTCTPDIWYM